MQKSLKSKLVWNIYFAGLSDMNSDTPDTVHVHHLALIGVGRVVSKNNRKRPIVLSNP